MATKTQPVMTQTQILNKLGIKVTPLFIMQLDGNGKLQQAINTEAMQKGLPEPFNPSLASTIIQDLLPFAAIATVGAASASSEAAAAESGAGGAATGAGAGGAASTALNAAKGALGALTLGSILTNFTVWKGLLMLIAGVALLAFGLFQLTKVAT